MSSLADNIDIIATCENLYRAVLPSAGFWDLSDKSISSGALVDKNGLSTDRSFERTEEECVQFLDSCKSKEGGVISFQVCSCLELDIHTRYDPTEGSDILPANPFHTLVVRSADILKLSSSQARNLSKKVKIIRWGLYPQY